MEDGKEGIISSTKPYSDAVVGYGRVSTVHGVFYVFEQGRWAVERVAWIIVLFVAIFLAVWWSLVAYGRWQDDPITITMATNALPIQKIPFPSITICPQGNGYLYQRIFYYYKYYYGGLPILTHCKISIYEMNFRIIKRNN